MRLTNCVYRFLDDENEIIYIGKAKNLKTRLNNHEHLPEECYLERVKTEFLLFETEDDMDFAERYYIPKYKPKYNVIWSAREITINIPMLDEKKWIEYGTDDFIREQVELLKVDDRKEFYNLSNESIGDSKEVQIEEINSKIEKIKNKIATLKEQKTRLDEQKRFWIYQKQNSEEVKVLKNKGYNYLTLLNDEVISLRRLNKDGRINYKDELRIDCFDTEESRFINDNQKIISEYLMECEEELKIAMNQRLKLVLGETFKTIDGYTKMQMIKYETFSIEDTLRIKIDEIISKSFNACRKEVEDNGYYYRSKLIASVYHNLSYCAFSEDRRWIKWIDSDVEHEQGEMKRTDKVRERANEIIDKIDLMLEKQYGTFEETTIIENTEYPIIGEKIPQAAIIRRPVYSKNVTN